MLSALQAFMHGFAKNGAIYGEKNQYLGVDKFRYQQKLDKIKEDKINSHNKDISYFIRFNYRDNITVESVLRRLNNAGIKIGEIYGA